MGGRISSPNAHHAACARSAVCYLLLTWTPNSYSYNVVRRFLRKPRIVEEPSTVDDTVRQIKARRIEGVYCGAYDEALKFHYPPDGVIVFEDGSQVDNNMAAPHGTGAAGLYFHESEDAPSLSDMVDYFSIPIDH